MSHLIRWPGFRWDVTPRGPGKRRPVLSVYARNTDKAAIVAAACLGVAIERVKVARTLERRA